MTSSSSTAVENVSDTVAGAARDIGDAMDKTYKSATGSASSDSKLSNNSNFSSDAKKLAKDVEKMKDDALKDGEPKILYRRKEKSHKANAN